MKTTRHRLLMKVLMKRYNDDYAKIAIWLKGSKTYGDGSYNYKKKCKVCGK